MSYYLIGDRYVKQIKNYQKYILKEKLTIKGKPVNIICSNKKNMDGALAEVKKITNAEKKIILIGSNDLVDNSVDLVFAKIYQLVDTANHKAKNVRICQMTPRLTENSGKYNQKVLALNKSLQKEISKKFWMHKNGVNVNKIRGDIVHFTTQGVKNLRCSIVLQRLVIECVLQRLVSERVVKWAAFCSSWLITAFCSGW